MAPLLPRLGTTTTSTPLSALKTAPRRLSNSVAVPAPPTFSVSAVAGAAEAAATNATSARTHVRVNGTFENLIAKAGPSRLMKGTLCEDPVAIR